MTVAGGATPDAVPVISSEQLRARIERFYNDPRFRIENLFKILTAQTRKVIPLRFNEAQLRVYETHQWFREHLFPVRIVICKSRRAGLSTIVEALIYDDTTMNPNTHSLIVANQSKPSENVLGMCTRFWKNTPESIKFGELEIRVRPNLPPQFNNNPPKDKLEFDEPLSSKIFVASAKSLDAYLSFGFQNIHATEGGYYDDGHELFRALYPTLSDDAHSALYIESTPNGQTGRGAWFYEQVMDAHERRTTEYGNMRLVFIPWHEMNHSFAKSFESDERRAAFGDSLNPNERDILRRFPHVSLEQLQWRRAKISGPPFNRDEDLFDQEYPSDLATAFIAGGSALFSRPTIKRLMATARDPYWVGDVHWGESTAKNERANIYDTIRRPRFLSPGEAIAEGFDSNTNEKSRGNLRVYRWPKKGERIIIGCDVGGGGTQTRDGDYSTIQVGVANDLERDEVVMTWKGRLGPLAFGEVASALAWGLRYMVGDAAPAPLLAPEWTGPGISMCTYIDTRKLYPFLYRYQAPGVHGLPKTKHIGWESNAKTKKLAVDYCLRMIERDIIDLPDKETILEMSSYRQLDSFGDESSFGGAAGHHDDLVSALQILCAVIRLNASPVPTDEPAEIVSMADESGDGLSPWNPFEDTLPTLSMPMANDEYADENLFWSGERLYGE